MKRDRVTAARSLITHLDELQSTIRFADVLQLVSVSASRTKEIAAEMIYGRLHLGEFQVGCASFASPHILPPLQKVDRSTTFRTRLSPVPEVESD
jgi:hypothetical protein